MAAVDIEKVKLENTLRRFKRFLNLGFEASESLKGSSDMDNIRSLEELISDFKNGGKMAVEQILLMNKQANLINRSFIITALAFCARNSNTDLDSKRLAYAALKKVCRTPFELFLFLDKREYFNVQYLLKNAKSSLNIEQVERSFSTGEIKPEPAKSQQPTPRLLEKRESRPSSAASVKNGQQAIVEKVPLLKLNDGSATPTKQPESARSSVVLPKINHDPALATPRIGSGKKPLSPIPPAAAPKVEEKAATARSHKDEDKPEIIGLMVPTDGSGKQKQRLSSKGWGRLQRKYVNEWYTSQNPFQLAVSIIRYQKKYNWTHRDVFRMSHPKSANVAHNLIFKYVTGGLKQAAKFYEAVTHADADFKSQKDEVKPDERVFSWKVQTKLVSKVARDPKDTSNRKKKRTEKPPIKNSKVDYKLTSEAIAELEKVYKFLDTIDSLKHCADEQVVCNAIRQYSLNDYQVPMVWLKSHAVWLAIMSCEWFTPAALIRRFMKIARLKLIRKNLNDKAMTRPSSSSGQGSDSAKAALEAELERVICDKLKSINIAPVHPIEIFTILRLYEHAKNDKKANRYTLVGKKTNWPVNEVVNEALNKALELSYEYIDCKDWNVSFSLNCWRHTRARTRKNSSLTPFQAMIVLFKAQLHEAAATSKVYAISGKLVDLDMKPTQSFQQVRTTLFNMHLGSGSGNHLAVEKALTDKEKYDAFIIYSNIEPTQLEKTSSVFTDYLRQMKEKPKCKLIFISFNKINQTLIKDSSNMNILELTGLSNQTPQIIDNFLNDLF